MADVPPANVWEQFRKFTPAQLAMLAEREPKKFQRYRELVDQELFERCRHDPLLFVETQFDWGRGELKEEDGPEDWQKEVLIDIRDNLNPDEAFRNAVASGHGVGKSCLVAWLVLWAICTLEDARGVITANTGVQLETKTWPELAKWFRLFKGKDKFKMTATALFSADPDHQRTWRLDAITWSEENVEAFAGLHNAGRRILLIYDEASAIGDKIWETSDGALTDANTEILWCVFGNPTKNTGRFRECWGRFRHRWRTRSVDSRSVRRTNKAELDGMVKDWGEDSDYVRIRVRGVFPRAGAQQFISTDMAEAAASVERDPMVSVMDALVMGVDVARFGEDMTVICFRRGRDARTIPWVKLRSLDNMQVAARVAELFEMHKPDAIFIDEGGLGGGVVDRCRYLRLPVTGVQFGANADRAVSSENEGNKFRNKRSEMWGTMKDWLKFGAIPNDMDLLMDLTGIEYDYVLYEGRDVMALERKADMKKRGLASPDNADSLCLTFAYPIAPSDHTKLLGTSKSRHEVQYNPFATSWSPQRAPSQQEQRQEWRYGGKR